MDWIMKNRWYNYTRLSEEEKKEYHKNYMINLRNNKRDYLLKIKRWLLWRYIKEELVFNKEDIGYIKSIPDYEFKNKKTSMKIMTRQKLIDMYDLPKWCNNIMNMVNYLSEKKSDEQIQKAKEAINISNKESYLSNLWLWKNMSN